MTPRLASSMLVGATIRRVQATGGTAAVLVKGDPTAGAIVLVCCERGEPGSIIERVFAVDGEYRWARVGPVPITAAAVNHYVEKRRQTDPDIWIVELDVAGVERFAAEMIAEG